MTNDWFALAAAATWAVSSLLSAQPSRQLGVLAFARYRITAVLLVFVPIVLSQGSWRQLDASSWLLLVSSGVVGIFIGDTAMFACMNRLGPRRTGVLYATNALFSALLGWLFLGEHIGLQAVLGGLLVVGGVMVAIAWGSRRDEAHHLETVHGSWHWGVALGLTSAICQAVGSAMAKPVLLTGVDSLTAATVRAGATGAIHWVVCASGWQIAQSLVALRGRTLGLTVLSGWIGMGLGMTLVMLALHGGDLGLVGVLSSVTPVMVLPLLWLVQGKPPARGAWLGALLTVVGTVLILTRQ